jgi:predicted PurR-regulated permease PerM
VIVDLIPTVGGTLAAIPIVLFAANHSLTAGIVTLIVCAIYSQSELHVLMPFIASRTVRISGTLTFLAVLIGVAVGNLIDGPFGGFAAALLAVPTAGALQIVVREIWRSTALAPPDSPFSPSGVPAPGDGTDGESQPQPGRTLTGT